MLIAIVVALLSGVTRTVARMANAQLSTRIGLVQSTFYNYLVGLVCSVLLLSLSREAAPLSAVSAGGVPAWAYVGGVLGVLFILLSSLTAPKMSAFAMTLLIFAGQIVAGVAIDLFVHQQLSGGNIAGGLLIVAGLLVSRSLKEDGKR